jgi:hypothetical protein
LCSTFGGSDPFLCQTPSKESQLIAATESWTSSSRSHSPGSGCVPFFLCHLFPSPVRSSPTSRYSFTEKGFDLNDFVNRTRSKQPSPPPARFPVHPLHVTSLDDSHLSSPPPSSTRLLHQGLTVTCRQKEFHAAMDNFGSLWMYSPVRISILCTFKFLLVLTRAS